jgi:hypothetical protein
MPTTPTFEALSLDALTTITGGCGKKKSAPCCPQPAPAPAPVGQAPAPAPSTPEVSTKVSISGY